MLRPIVFLVTLAVHTLRALFRAREELLSDRESGATPASDHDEEEAPAAAAR